MADSAAAASSPAVATVFGAAAAGKKGKPTEPRTMLKNMDTLAWQACDPYGPSVVDDASLDDIWKIICKGNKWAKFFAEIASPEDERKGIFLSRFCQTLANIIDEIGHREDLRACIKEDVLEAAMVEARVLLPHLKLLNAGKTSLKEKDSETIGGLKRRRVQAPDGIVGPTESQLQESSKVLYEYIKKGTDSDLRMLIQFLSAGGMFWAGQCMDLSAQSWFACTSPKPDAAAFEKALKTRHTGTGASASSGSKRKDKATGSLFKKGE